MEWDEFTRHNNRRELVKCVTHLLEAQRGLTLATEHIKLIGTSHPLAMDIEQNVDALRAGIADTLTIAGILADEIQRAMKSPLERPPPVSASCGKVLTPFQRALQREGVNFDTIPKHEPTKQELRLPKILTFTLRRKPRKNRHRMPI